MHGDFDEDELDDDGEIDLVYVDEDDVCADCPIVLESTQCATHPNAVMDWVCMECLESEDQPEPDRYECDECKGRCKGHTSQEPPRLDSAQLFADDAKYAEVPPRRDEASPPLNRPCCTGCPILDVDFSGPNNSDRPTEWAYEQVCGALKKNKEKLAVAREQIATLEARIEHAFRSGARRAHLPGMVSEAAIEGIWIEYQRSMR